MDENTNIMKNNNSYKHKLSDVSDSAEGPSLLSAFDSLNGDREKGSFINEKIISKKCRIRSKRAWLLAICGAVLFVCVSRSFLVTFIFW